MMTLTGLWRSTLVGIVGLSDVLERPTDSNQANTADLQGSVTHGYRLGCGTLLTPHYNLDCVHDGRIVGHVIAFGEQQSEDVLSSLQVQGRFGLPFI